MIVVWLLLALLSLIGIFSTAMTLSAMRTLGYSYFDSKSAFRLPPWVTCFFRGNRPRRNFNAIAFSVLTASLILKILYIVASAVLLVALDLVPADQNLQVTDLSIVEAIFLSLGLLVAYLVLGDFLPRLLAHSAPQRALKLGWIVCSPFFIILVPVTIPILKLVELFIGRDRLRLFFEPQDQSAERLLEAWESTDGLQLETQERKLLTAVISFKHKVAREVMVPRVRVFCLDASKSIADAAELVLPEGYSRVPLVQDSPDKIVGVLLVKDLLRVLSAVGAEALDKQQPISGLSKPVLFVPENKRISSILQEFRTKQLHMAIVVDEYGGTEGILTIEDILEEIVGDIADEYDHDEDVPFIAQEEGAWLVDAQMNILDLADKLDIHLPNSPEYDTLGGYIFHVTGTIPPVGARIHTENFDLEIVASSDRCVEQVRIRPVED